MNKLKKISTLFLFLFILTGCSQSEEEVIENTTPEEISIDQNTESSEEKAFTISFTDPLWDGITVPEGQWCSMFEGNGSTPEIQVDNIPEGTQALTIAASDRSFAANDNGGHGIFGITVSETSITVPSIPGESLELSENMFAVENARSSRSNGGVYLPPCSGGSGNEYYITVQALDSIDIETANVLASQDIEMGIY